MGRRADWLSETELTWDRLTESLLDKSKLAQVRQRRARKVDDRRGIVSGLPPPINPLSVLPHALALFPIYFHLARRSRVRERPPCVPTALWPCGPVALWVSKGSE